MDTWQLIAKERSTLADGLTGLSEQEWNAPSLCAGWTNRDTLAHIVSTAEMTAGKFLAGMVATGFHFDRMTAKNIAHIGTDDPGILLGRLRAAAGSHNHPPGPVAAMLMEIVVHGEDIAYAQGRKLDHSADGLRAAAEFAKNAQPLVHVRSRISGLTMKATDFDWQTGSGPEVRGPLVALLLAMSGRGSALDECTGDGVAILRARA